MIGKRLHKSNKIARKRYKNGMALTLYLRKMINILSWVR